MKRLFTIFLFTCFISVGFAYGDGMYVSDHYTHLYEPSQKAVISWNGKRETMILSAAVKSEDLANFAWVVPIQSRSKPSVSAGDIRVFKDLVDYFKKPDSSEHEMALIDIYLDIRKANPVSLETKQTFYTRLEKFANELNTALGTKIFDHDRLKNDLYRDAFIYTLKSRRNQSKTGEHPKSTIPLSNKILSIYGRLKALPRTESGDLYETAIALRRGMATPLKFEFEPMQPIYPLHISSLNWGKSLIEVYVISSAPMKDENQMLRVDEAKNIDPNLRRKLLRHIDMSSGEYVTRLSYRGALRKLSADAVFQAHGANVSGQ